jgi:hypothetical protein
MVAHDTYLTRDSDFFKAALKKEWSEGQTRTINLAEERPEAMAQYIGYAYSKRLSSEERVHTGIDDFKHAYHLLAMLYVYGERFINPTIQTVVIKELFRLPTTKDTSGSLWHPSVKDINIIYRGTPETSAARRFLVDLHVSSGNKNYVHEMLEHAFFVDVAKAFHEMRLKAHGDLLRPTLELGDYI